MASTIRVSELLWRVSDQLSDTDPQFNRWTQETLVNAANDGQQVLATVLPTSCVRNDAIKLVPGTRQSIEAIPAARIKPGDGSTAVDRIGTKLMGPPVRNLGATGTTPGRAIRAVDRASLDLAEPNWHTSVGKTVLEAVYDPLNTKVFYVYPGVTSAQDVWIEVAWVPQPLQIPLAGDYAKGSETESDLVLSVDDINVPDLVHYMLATLYLRDAEFAGALALAGAHTQLFVTSMNAQNPAAKLKGLPQPAAPAGA